jgi:hypothetical protein
MKPEVIIHDESRIVPFWLRLPKFFLFPLQGGMLIVLVPLALASLLAPILPMPKPFDLLLTEALIWLAALRHAFTVMDGTSRGLLTAEEQAHQAPNPDRVNLPWKLLAVIFLWAIPVGFATGISPMLGWVMNLFVVVAMPASIMALSVTNSLFQGMNPLLWISIMRTVGRAYLALFVFLMFLSGGVVAASPLLAPFMGGWLAVPLLNLAFLYFNLIAFNMMGYALYQYHRELGIEVKVDFAEQEKRGARRGGRDGKTAAQADPVAEAVAARVAAGDLDGALDAAYEQQRQEPENLTAQERYHKLLLLADKKPRALEHGQRYLATLLRLGRDDQAFDLFQRLRDLDGGFRPEQPGHLLKLAEQAYRRRDPVLALSLVHGFDKQNPRHPDIPGVYMLAARIMSEHYRKDDMAGAILRGLLQKYPEHPLAAEADVFLRALDRLAARAG